MSIRAVLAGLVLLLQSGCAHVRTSSPRRPPDATLQVETTAYCSCGSCCGWRRNWFGRPVIAYGPSRGRRKEVGLTASGTQARRGTIAADTRVFPFGTILYIPGYGYGRVEDRGGAIQGRHIDLYFPTHREALEWGRVMRRVQVWGP